MKSEQVAWVIVAALSAALCWTGLLLVGQSKLLKAQIAKTKEAVGLGMEAIEELRSCADLPPSEVILAKNNQTGDVIVRVDGKHFYEFGNVCAGYRM